jgi:L-threonylcarbamoyladenylate synthase
MLRKVIRRVRMLPGPGIRDPGSGWSTSRPVSDPSTGRAGAPVPARGAPMPSPGMLEKHYSPRAALTLYEGKTDVVLQSLIEAARVALADGRSVGIIAAEEDRTAFAALGSQARLLVRAIGSQDAPDVVASKLYPTLRELDAAGADVILVRGFPDHGLFAAVQDRLRRAAAGRIVHG